MPASIDDSMSEALKKLMRQIADIMTLPDADLQFLTSLQETITSYIRQQSAAMAGMQTGTGPQSAINDVAPGGMGGMLAGGMGGGMGGLAVNPNPDELRRLLTANSTGG